MKFTYKSYTSLGTTKSGMVALVAQLFFRYGAMNSGKTIEILKAVHILREEQDKSVIIMTSGLDDRDEVGYVSSRIGLKRKAYPMLLKKMTY